MKYLFQQMIAFWAIILTILIIVGVSFTQFTRQTMMTTTYQQMEGYADSIRENSMDEPGELLSNIRLTEVALQHQQVVFMYIDAQKVVQHPDEVEGSSPSFISDESWKNVQKGDGTAVRTTLEAPVGSHRKELAAMILKPLYISNGHETKFYGAIAVLQPIKYMEQSMKALIENLFKGFLISSVIALFFSYGIARFQVNRINRMKKATRQIAEGNFDVDLEIKGNDELDELAQDFNRMAEALKESNEEIERQENRRRQFMADAAHEMRTPLTTINGLLEGIAYNAIPKDQEEKCIKLMRNETTRLIRLVNENLDYEKIRSNQIKMVKQTFNGTEALSQIVQQLQGKAEASGNTLCLLTTDAVMVYADYDRFVQVIVNITQNAIQFTTDGKIELSLTKSYLETIVEISDTGIGMSQDEVKNIWERYYKVDPSRKNTKYGESGLGLAIVHQLVKLHKGHIEVMSEKGVGTTFKIVFPDKELPKHEQETALTQNES
ncbi:sensor histidine kinase [Vagococcus intermedius]|uniref:histidine kinase n=1 Tax=Vagococcus intermedius TaxID=2991418 RepID=A0AAF0I708_9ENTE|nr:HAMP domain-containing sensor histidine kinase [Vagococcus intermedius]WEG73020.1 HAMP domain-containing histidine kinase [Vagococcus intermedius]WEG75105.1 HAMP domain-containing histidine kinase [Vagococcus intermedius]